MEWDELDRELEEYNAERGFGGQAAPEPEEKEKTGIWTPFDGKEETASELDYQLQYQQLENVRSKLNDRMNRAKESYQNVEEEKKKTSKMLWNEWFGTTAVLILICLIMSILSNTELFMAWLLLAIAILIFAIRQYRILVKLTVRHRIRSISDPVHPFVEAKKIKTYAKEQEYWHAMMGRIKENIDHLNTWEKRLQANHGLQEEEMTAMQRLAYVDEIPSVYVDDKPTLGDWIRFRS